jgi:hypothetical protein
MDRVEVGYHSTMRYTIAGWAGDVHPGNATTLNFGWSCLFLEPTSVYIAVVTPKHAKRLQHYFKFMV